ncbi:MAG: polysulfide reductase, partial [Oligoflexia bacterium]|nr:polysulfide reductase [Oligoflexia bacterium]
ALVPWIWTAEIFNVVAALIFLTVDRRKRIWLIDLACALTLSGIWVEKGLGLIVPGFIPSTLHELVEYLPNALEWKVSLGITALSLIVFTLGLKIAIAVFSGEARLEGRR